MFRPGEVGGPYASDNTGASDLKPQFLRTSRLRVIPDGFLGESAPVGYPSPDKEGRKDRKNLRGRDCGACGVEDTRVGLLTESFEKCCFAFHGAV